MVVFAQETCEPAVIQGVILSFMFVGNIALLVIFGYLIIRSTDKLVNELRNIAWMTKIGKYGLTAFLLAFATSLPELAVGVTSALEGRPELSLGNVLGSNIANVSLVIGGTAFVGGGFRVVGEFLKRELFSTFLAGSLPLLLLIDGSLSRIDGLVLLVVYIWFTYTVLAKKTEELAEYQESEGPLMRRLFARLRQDEVKGHYLWFGFWVLVMLFSANMLVKVSVSMAGALGIPLILIGILFVAVGTSLPELAFGLKASRSGETEMVFGNLLGSVVANSTLILGITALITPVVLDGGFSPYLLATVAFVLIFAVFWIFVSSKRMLERWEGAMLLLLYFVFVIFELARVNGSAREFLGELTSILR